MQYYIRIDNRNVYVSEEIYKFYCKGERKERYFRESDIHNKTFYYNALDTEDFNGCDLFQDTRSKPVDEQAEEALERSLLFEAMKDLDPREKDIIRRIYCYDQSLRQISRGNRSSRNHPSLPSWKDPPQTAQPHGLKGRGCTDSHSHLEQKAVRADIQVFVSHACRLWTAFSIRF